jgi:nicotinate-nucleotide--dimethylbenzimidazole phosphoribosyltransferase
VIRPPSVRVYADARQRLDGLAKPLGALGRVEDLGAWLSACQGVCPPRPLERVRAVILAGDHGVSHDGVSAYPREVTAAMVRAFVAGVAGASCLARQHGVALRVLDLGVDDDLADLPAEVSAYHIGPSAPLHRQDALTAEQCQQGLAVGRAVAEAEIAAGADLLILGDMGIGNTTPAAALIAASFGVGAEQVVGRGTGIDDDRLTHKTAILTQALDRMGDRVADPRERLAGLGSADLAVGVGFLCTAARRGVPVLLDGIVSLAELAVAEELEPGVIGWCAAGHRSTEPAQQLALDKLGLEPILDLGLRLGEGTGALLALPVLRSAGLLLTEMALLSDLTSGG